MTLLRAAGAAACLLALVAPATAASRMDDEAYHAYHALHGAVAVHRMPAQDFDHFDFGIARPTYHSGWAGPYGDGDYPGTVDQNMGPPYWVR